MNSRQRVLETIALGEPDRVPIALYEMLVGAKMMDMPFGRIFLDGKFLAKSRISVYEEFGQDIIDIETGIATEAEACGCIVEYPDDSAPWIKEPVLDELSDISKLKVPNPCRSRAMYANLEAVGIVSSELGKDVFIIGEADQGPFSLASELRGMERFFMDLICAEDEEAIHELLEFTSEVFLCYARALKEAGADVVCMGESPAGTDLISPELYMKFAQPYETKTIETLHREGILVANHMCGCVDRIIDPLIDTGAEIIEIDETTDLKLAKERSRGRTVIMGCVAPGNLAFGSRKSIEKEVRENLEVCMAGYGYILSPGCVLGANTPIDSIRSFVDFGREFGKY